MEEPWTRLVDFGQAAEAFTIVVQELLDQGLSDPASLAQALKVKLASKESYVARVWAHSWAGLAGDVLCQLKMVGLVMGDDDHWSLSPGFPLGERVTVIPGPDIGITIYPKGEREHKDREAALLLDIRSAEARWTSRGGGDALVLDLLAQLRKALNEESSFPLPVQEEKAGRVRTRIGMTQFIRDFWVTVPITGQWYTVHEIGLLWGKANPEQPPLTGDMTGGMRKVARELAAAGFLERHDDVRGSVRKARYRKVREIDDSAFPGRDR